MKVPIRKEDYPIFEQTSKDAGYRHLKYNTRTDNDYIWITFEGDQYDHSTILLLMYHTGKRVMMKQLLNDEKSVNY